MESGHAALQVWGNHAMANAPISLKIWLGIMALSFLSGLLFCLRHSPPRWCLLGFGSGLLASKLIAPLLGVTTYSGFVACLHLLFWSPGLFLLLLEIKNGHKESFSSFYRTWRYQMIAVISISFIFDLRDAAIYLRWLVTG